MHVTSHLCLTMIEAWPIALNSVYGSRLQEYSFVLGEREFGCNIEVFGDCSGYFNSGLDYELDNIGWRDILMEDEPLLSWVKAKFERERDRWNEKRSTREWIPIRIIVIWKHETTVYEDTPMGPGETETTAWPVQVLDLEHIKEIVHD